MEALKLYTEIRQNLNLAQTAKLLSLHTGTLKRWELENRVPQDYLFELNAILGNRYNLSKENFRTHSEFFTKKSVAAECLGKFKSFLQELNLSFNEFFFIEPSVGDGAFYELLPQNKIGIDIEKKGGEILHTNFLDFTPNLNGKRCVVIGNPPFGLRGNLALKFLNHAANFADFVAFILPPLFDSDGKGSPSKRICGLNLVFNEMLPLDSFVYPNGKSVEVATNFQIYASDAICELLALQILKKPSCKEFIRVYSLSDGGTPSSTRNKKMLNLCDVYLPSTCFHSKNKPKMRVYESFEELPNRRGYGVVVLKEREVILNILKKTDWEKESFKGTNSSLNLRTSIIESVVLREYYGNL